MNPTLQTPEIPAPSSLDPKPRTCIQAGHGARVYLTECIYQFVLESQSPQKLSTYCLLLLIKIFRWRFCGGVDFLISINEYIVTDKSGHLSRSCSSNSLNFVRLVWKGPNQVNSTKVGIKWNPDAKWAWIGGCKRDWRRGVGFQKVNSPTTSSTHCLLLPIKILSWRFCGGGWLSKTNRQIHCVR